MDLATFNTLDATRAAQLLRPCLDIDRWIAQLVRARPFASVSELLRTAQTSATPLTEAEVNAALAQHPRLGQRVEGSTKESELSRNEQASLNLDNDLNVRLAAANQDYEQRFERVFLIRAAGRSGDEILSECRRRLQNDAATELQEVCEQLRDIALLRLTQMVSSTNTAPVSTQPDQE